MLSPRRLAYGGFTLSMKSGAVHDLVLVNVAEQPVRPAIYFYDKAGGLIDPESVVGRHRRSRGHRVRRSDPAGRITPLGRGHPFDPRSRRDGNGIGEDGL